MVVVRLVSNPQDSAHNFGTGSQDEHDDALRMRLPFRSHIWRPPTDIWETEQAFTVRLEIAGMSERDFSIVLDGHSLVIRGVRSESPERRAYHQMEIPFGEFGVDIDLPSSINISAVEAVYSNGFLRISLPKTGPQKIKIEE
jgi:HSP20 family protein